MAKQVVTNYTFSASGKTVTLTDFTTIQLNRIMLITNVTANIIIYQFNSTLLGGTVATNVVTLTYNTSAMSNTDKLQIIYELAVGDTNYDIVQPINGTVTSNVGTTNGLALDATLTGGTQQVQGNVAAGASDSGNPVKVGGQYTSTLPTLTTGQRGNVQLDSSGRLIISAPSATGTAIPSNAFMIGLSNGTNLSAAIQAVSGLNSTGGGIEASSIIGQFDDVSPASITENQFGHLRMSANRNQYVTLRDAAGNERGVNVTSSNALVVDNSSVSPALAPSATALNTFSIHLTSNTTTTPTASTAYISSISISNEVGGTTSTMTIQDKQGTPLKLVNGLATTALTTAPTTINFQTPVKMVNGIDVITTGAVAATVDVWINYYQ